ncbi:MAG TPA: hypothetical protein VJ600_00490 [Holophagaceae bacterium]|nr:hypothetical protein [Holophagaceae bacterium]
MNPRSTFSTGTLVHGRQASGVGRRAAGSCRPPRFSRLLAPALLALLALACAKEDRSGLMRRGIAAPPQSGWARVKLDGEAQRQWDTLWIGDEGGRPIPFLRERDDLWAPVTLETEPPLMGKDDQGDPTVEFALKLPQGWQLREREHLQIDLDLEGEAPWVAQVRAARRAEDGAFINLEEDAPTFVHDLGHGQRVTSLTLPWDAARYRLNLLTTQGKAPKIRGLRITACTRPVALGADEEIAATLERLPPIAGERMNRWSIKLPAPERVIAMDVALKPPVAPVGISVSSGDKQDAGLPHCLASGILWDLPALGTRSSRLSLWPELAEELVLSLPEAVEPLSVKLFIRREVLLFPAEAGHRYALHYGGGTRRAPGSLEALPSSRAIYTRQPLALSAAEADPEGQPKVVSASERTKPWLPWAASVVVLALAFVAFKLLKGPAD